MIRAFDADDEGNIPGVFAVLEYDSLGRVGGATPALSSIK